MPAEQRGPAVRASSWKAGTHGGTSACSTGSGVRLRQLHTLDRRLALQSSVIRAPCGIRSLASPRTLACCEIVADEASKEVLKNGVVLRMHLE